MKQIRPKTYNNHKEADLKFKALFYQLQHDRVLLFSLRKALLSQFLNSNFVSALTESGMVSSRGFLQELLTKLKHKVLPPLLQPNDFLYVINHIFYKSKDYIWIEKLDRQLWINFFKVLGIQVSVTDKSVLQQLNQSLYILTKRTVTLGFEKEVVNSCSNAFKYEVYPFYILDKSVQNYLQLFKNQVSLPEIYIALLKIVKSVQGCKKIVENISEQRRKNGTSLSQTYILFRIEQHLERLLIITDVLDSDKHFNVEQVSGLFYYRYKK